jgi:hypothetical protein
MVPRLLVRNVVFALLGAVALVLKHAYHGPLEETVHSYGGNVSVSFALYFLASNATALTPRPRLIAAVATLVAVEAFELSDGFGVMANTVDPVDLVANAVGIALAVAVDLLSLRVMRRPADRAEGRRPPS